MRLENELVRRIVSHAGIPSRRLRRDLERELNAHFEDAAEAARTEEPGVDPRPAICFHFGDPNEIALQFKHLHRLDRIGRFVLDTSLLTLRSVLAVAALIAIFQVIAALSLGLSPAAPQRLLQQIASITALVLGYVGAYSGYRAFRGWRTMKVLALEGICCAAISALGIFLPHFDPTAPLMTLVIGASVRLLQGTGLRRVWFLAPVIPVMAACLFSRGVISAGNEIPLWAAAMIRCAGLTAACRALMWLSRRHEACRLD